MFPLGKIQLNLHFRQFHCTFAHVKHILAVIPLFLLLTLLAGCGQRTRVEAQLDTLDSILSIPPDGPEALVDYDSIFHQLDSLQPSVIGDDALEARWNLLFTMAEDKSDRPLLLDLRIRPAYDYYAAQTQDGTRGDSILLHRFAQSCFYLGAHYYQCDSLARMEQLMHRSAEVSKSCGDHYTAYLALTYLSERLIHSNNTKAIQLALESLDEYQKSPFPSIYNKICVLLNIGNCYFWGIEKDKSLDYFEKALSYSLQNDSVLLGNIYSDLSLFYVSNGDCDNAVRYLQKVLSLNSLSTGKVNEELLANVFLSIDSLERAEDVLENMLPHANSYKKLLVFQNLQSIALRKNDTETAKVWNDSIRIDIWNMHIEDMRDNFVFFQKSLDSEKKSLYLTRTVELHKTWFMIAVILCAFIIAVIVIVVRVRITHKEKMLKLERLRRSLLADFNERQILQKEQEIQWKNEKLEILKSHLVLQSDIIDRLRAVENSDTQFVCVSDTEWANLEDTLNEIYEGFVDHLRQSFPSLNNDSLRLCMLQKIHLTNRQMANIFVLELSSITKRKQRIKSVLSPSFGENLSFDEMIEKI